MPRKTTPGTFDSWLRKRQRFAIYSLVDGGRPAVFESEPGQPDRWALFDTPAEAEDEIENAEEAWAEPVTLSADGKTFTDRRGNVFTVEKED